MKLRGDFLVFWFAAQFVRQLDDHLAHARNFIDEMHWQADRFGLISQGSLHALFDPPSGVGG